MTDAPPPPPPPPPGGYGAPPPPPGGYGAPPPPPGGYGAPPPGGYGGPRGPKPDNNLVWAILSTVFCCLPLGIASIVFAAQVDSKWNQGDYAGAQEASEKAKRFAMISAGVGVGLFVLFFLVSMIGGMSAESDF